MLIAVLRAFDKAQRKACEPASVVHVEIMSQELRIRSIGRHPTGDRPS